MDDVRAMRHALALAERGRSTVSPNPMVGCVVLADGAVVGEGWHHVAGGPHAEVVALQAAGDRARSATVYVTLEPCTHTGRTPPCVDALIRAAVGRVVIASTDPNPVAAGGADALRGAGIAVDVGLLRNEAAGQNEVFLHGVRMRRPFVWLKGAVSLDGRVTAADGSSRWLTGAAARRHAHGLRAQVDAMVVGSGTVLADDPRLTVRLQGWTGPQPLRVVLDGRARTPVHSHVYDRTAPSLALVAPGAHDQVLRDAGVAVTEVKTGADGRLDPAAVLDVLWERGVRSLCVEGGPTVFTSFVRTGCFDRLVLYMAPLLLGDGGVPLLSGGPATLADAERFGLRRVEQVGDDVVLHLDRREA
ncbi:MAG TPA: bifunctional diaminohydroxyphosphoribosylaminopyrimidine deaminase/5-amino-6-(5-phosphoribosylamino)uracil reductase RibD [Euzebyales bacterium]|nr:bifunctional diaminohydroxyphosphoribosylaminopyrimidine deaminase/5-amino-6-(5-phosphoribosylamino)uracil reductase RibD [Euzebyales bacterium]